MQYNAAPCNTRQHVAACCSTQQQAAVRCKTLLHTATHLLVQVERTLIQHVTLLQYGSSIALGVEGKQTRERVRIVRGRHMLLQRKKRKK